jgi:hypothetical protein
MYTDTDSIVCWIKTKDIKQDIKNMGYWFQTQETYGIPGVMKVEKDNLIEFRAYCPKQYYYIHKVNGEYKVSETFKGIPKRVRKGKDLTQEEIIEHLSKNQPLSLPNKFEMKVIRSREHEVQLVNIVKNVSGKDDKRLYIDEYHTVALGYTT